MNHYKILFITLGRTGSTNLCKGISKIHSLELLDEPFNKSNEKLFDYYFSKIKNSKSIIVKHIISQTPKKNEKYTDFIQELIQHFDFVVTLGRKNTKEHYESLCNLRYKNENNQNSFTKYQYKSIPESFKSYYESILTIEKLEKYHSIVESISDEHKIPKLYYEDLYSNSIDENYKKIQSILPFLSEKIKKYLDSQNKFRVDFLKKTTI